MNLKIGLTQQTRLKLMKGKKTRNTQSSYTQTGSKSEHGVGSGVAIFAGNELAAQLKFKLDKKYSNNQGEQLATVKALEAIETLDITENGLRTAAQSLQNITNHNFLIEEMRKKVSILEAANWKIEISWVKVHVGTHRNELADQLPKKQHETGTPQSATTRSPRGLW